MTNQPRNTRHDRFAATHGMRRTKLYNIWAGIKQRTRNPNSPIFKHYGGRGITMEDSWFESFQAFHQGVGEPPFPKCCLDRIDNNYGYHPGNVRWVDMTTQGRNKRSNRLIEHGGASKPLSVWSEETGIESSLIAARIDRLGWSIERALTQPVRHFHKEIA